MAERLGKGFVGSGKHGVRAERLGKGFVDSGKVLIYMSRLEKDQAALVAGFSFDRVGYTDGIELEDAMHAAILTLKEGVPSAAQIEGYLQGVQ